MGAEKRPVDGRRGAPATVGVHHVTELSEAPHLSSSVFQPKLRIQEKLYDEPDKPSHHHLRRVYLYVSKYCQK